MKIEEVEEFEPPVKEEEEGLTAIIDSLDYFGATRIRFSEEIQTQHLNKSYINDTMLDIYVQPSLDWHLQDENFDVNSTLNLTWSVLDF